MKLFLAALCTALAFPAIAQQQPIDPLTAKVEQNIKSTLGEITFLNAVLNAHITVLTDENAKLKARVQELERKPAEQPKE